MVEVEVEVTIHRPVEDVFSFVADLTNDPVWHVDVLDAQPVSRVAGRPATYNLVLKYPRDELTQQAVAEVFASEDRRRLRISADAGALRQVMSYHFEALGSDTTRVVRSLHLEHDDMPSEMVPTVRPNIERRSAMYLQKLKSALEFCGCEESYGSNPGGGCQCSA